MIGDGLEVWDVARGMLKPIHLSNEKRAPGCLGDLLGTILSSYIGIIINHCKDLY